jgi:hypothetical protein
MIKKICTKCSIEKLSTDFSKGRTQCKTCKMDYWRERQKIHKARSKSDIIIPEIKTCRSCKENKSGKEFYIDLTKPSGLRSDCIKCYNKKTDLKRRKDPRKRAIKNMSHRYRAICRDHNLRKNETTIKSLGCSSKFFAVYIEKQFKPGMTWENYGEWHIDHIRPWASIDMNNKEEVDMCRHYTNLRPLWAYENLEKGGKWQNTT